MRTTKYFRKLLMLTCVDMTSKRLRQPSSEYRHKGPTFQSRLTHCFHSNYIYIRSFQHVIDRISLWEDGTWLLVVELKDQTVIQIRSLRAAKAIFQNLSDSYLYFFLISFFFFLSFLTFFLLGSFIVFPPPFVSVSPGLSVSCTAYPMSRSFTRHSRAWH